MAETLNLTLRINADGTAAIVGLKQVAEAENQVGSAGKKAGADIEGGFSRARGGVQSISEQLKTMKEQLLGLAGLHFAKEFIADIIDANTKLQGWRYGLEAATGSTTAAADALAFVRAESNRLGISLESSASIFTRLAAATKGTAVEGLATQKVFTGVAEAARTLHLSAADTQSVLLALEQMMSKGTVQAQDLKMQLGNVLPGAMHIAAESIGVTVQQFDKMMEKGQIVSEDFLPKFAERLHELYAATAADASNSPAAAIGRLTNAWFELKAAIGDAGVMSTLANAATGVAHALNAIVQSGALDIIVRGLIAVGGGMAVAWAVGALRTWMTSMALAVVAIEGATEAQTVLNVAMRANPIGIVVTALFALYEAYEYVSNAEKKRAEEMASINRQVDTAISSTQDLVAALHAVDGSGFGKLGNAVRTYGADLQSLRTIQDEIVVKQKEYADASTVYLEHGIKAFDNTTPEARALKLELDGLQAKAAALGGEMQPLAESLQKAGFAAGQSAEFVKMFGADLDDLRAKASAGSWKAAIASMAHAWSDYSANAGTAAALDKQAASARDAAAANAAKNTEALVTAGKTRAQIAQQLGDAELAAAKAAGTASAETIAHIQETTAARVKDAAALDAATHKQKDKSAEIRNFADELQNAKDKLAAMTLGSSDYARALTTENTAIAAGRKLIDDAIAAKKKGIATQAQLDDAIKTGNAIQEEAKKNYAATTEKIDEQVDSLYGLIPEYEKQIAEAGGMTDAQRLVADATEQATRLWKEHHAELEHQGQTLDSVRDKLIAEAQTLGKVREETRLNQQASQEWASVFQGAFDAVLQTSGNIWTKLKAGFKNLTDSIIQYFERLAVINPIMNWLFGGMAGNGYSMQPTMSNAGGMLGMMFGGGAGGSGSSIVGIGQALLGGGDSGAAGGASGGGFDLFSASSWIGAGQKLWSGFQAGFPSLFGSGSAAAGSSILGSWSGTQSIAGASYVNLPGGGVAMVGGQSMPGVYTPGTFGTVAGIAGGLYAGYGEYKAAGGGIAGLAGGAAYGLGTIGAMGVAGSMMAGGTAAAGMAGAMGSVGLGAIPVVGWIALAAMAINMISGGKLFGTAAKPIGGDLTTSIDNSGATLTNTLHEKGQKALFGGAYYKDKNLPVDPQAMAAAQAFFDALKKGTSDFASQFGLTMTDIVGGTFTQKYDKKGKPTTTETVVNGVTYTGETSEQFQERLQADSYLAVLDKMGVGASAYVKGLQGDADALFKAVQDLGATAQAAYADINRGMGLLGPDGNLGAVMTEVEKLAGSGEALADAYTRLQQEQAAWKSSVEAMTLTMGKSASETLEFADALAKAFGGAGAMQQALQTFDANYNTQGQLTAIKIANDKAQLAALGAGIGQDPTETMAQFKSAFDAVASSLTPDQLAQWVNFGNLLAQVTGEIAAVADSAAQAAARLADAKQQYANYEVSTQGDAFTQSLVKIVQQEKANIDTANALAIAAGNAGASQTDLAVIIGQGTLAIGQAVAQLSAGLMQDVSTLNSTLNSSVQIAKPTVDGIPMAQWRQQQAQAAADDAKNSAAQLAAQKISAAYDAIQKIGDLSYVSGKSADDIFAQFKLDPNTLAKTLGLSVDDVKKQIDFQAKSDATLATMASQGDVQNGLLQDILATLQGTKLPYDISSLGAPDAMAATGSKVVPVVTTPPANASMPVPPNTGNTPTLPPPDTTRPIVDATDTQTRTIGGKLDDILRVLSNGRFIPGARNTRGAYVTP